MNVEIRGPEHLSATTREPDSAAHRTEGETMTAQHALTPISGTNGYQQQIAIDPNEPLTLSVANASGRITIVGSDQPNAWVVVRRTDDRHDDDVGVAVSVDGNTISIRPEWQIASGLQGLAKRVRDQLQHGFNSDDWDLSKLQLHPDLDYDIRVEIPRDLADGSRIQARSASGRIDISGAHADVTGASASGALRLTDITGKTTVNSAGGSVRAHNVSGSLEVNTASGRIEVGGGEVWTALRTMSGSVKLDDVTLKNARIVTVSGSVHGMVTAPNAIDYSIETVSGSVRLDARLPATGSTARLSVKSISGSAKVDGDWVMDGKRQWRLGSGEDGPQFRVKTVSGSLKCTGHADPEVMARREPMPVPLPASSEDDAEADTGMATKPFAPDAASGDGEQRGKQQGKQVTANLDLDVNLDKAFAWAKDAARAFTGPTPPSPPAPPSSVSPADPVAPTTSLTPPTPVVTSHDGADTGDTAPLTTISRSPASTEAEREAAQADLEAEQEAERAELEAEREAEQAERDAIVGAAVESATAGQAEREADATGDTSSLDSADAERLHILEALERGEIDVDEALATIEREESRRA